MDAGKTGALSAQLRKEKGWNQKELADRIGVTNKAISRWETGRGYPDLESIPELCRVLGISVQELLDGELHPEAAEPEQVVETVCQHAARENRRQSRMIAALAAILALAVLARVSVEMYYRLPGFVQSVVGSKNCIIAEDYESLTFYGETYIPLPMNGYECSLGEVLIEECQVEGYGFWAKLLFGERLLEVRGVPDQQIVYLQTEYDSNPSDYFVLESEYEKYVRLLEDGTYDCYYANNWGVKEFLLDEQTWQMIAGAGEEIDYDPYNAAGGFFIFAYEQNHIFRRTEGEILKYDSGFCWMPYDYDEEFGSNMMSYTFYRIGEAAWGVLEEIHAAFDEY